MKGFVTKFVPALSARVLPRSTLSTTVLKTTCGGKAQISTRASMSRAMPNSSTVYYSAPLNADWSARFRPSFPREITWLAGAPGAGKGTNSSYIATARGYTAPTIVMSSLLESPECKRIKDAGGMVDDETVFKALIEELAKPEYSNGVVVDGFPRTEKQAQFINTLYDTMRSPASPLTFNFVMLFIEEEAAVARQLSRGDAIHKLNVARAASGLAPLEERATDTNEDAARLRYRTFLEQYDTINKLSARFPLSVVDASASIDVVRNRLSSSLKSLTSPTPSFASSLRARL